MKLTTARLKKLIKEAVLEEYGGPNFTPEQQAVADKAKKLQIAIEAMKEQHYNDDLVEFVLIELFQVLKAAGYDPASIARLA